jgi:hypothetical protein
MVDMKKMFLLIGIVFILITISGCSSNNNSNENDNNQTVATTPTTFTDVHIVKLTYTNGIMKFTFNNNGIPGFFYFTIEPTSFIQSSTTYIEKSCEITLPIGTLINNKVTVTIYSKNEDTNQITDQKEFAID